MSKTRIIYETDGLPSAEDHPKCRRCNRTLVNPKWRRIGYGPTCITVARYERIMLDAGLPVNVEASNRIRRAQARANAKLEASQTEIVPA